VKQGAHPQVPNNEGDTAEQLREQQLKLLRAVQSNQLTAVQQSAQQSMPINPEQHDQAGNTPLHLAVMQGNWAMVQWLVTHLHCNPSARNHQGQTILHLAAVHHGAAYYQALATQFPHLKQIQDYQGLEARAQLPSAPSPNLLSQQSPNSEAQKSQADKKQATETTEQSGTDQVCSTNSRDIFDSSSTNQLLRRRLTPWGRHQCLTDDTFSDASSSLSFWSQTSQHSSPMDSITPDDGVSSDDEDSLQQRPLLKNNH
jgi:hypothetical protein